MGDDTQGGAPFDFHLERLGGTPQLSQHDETTTPFRRRKLAGSGKKIASHPRAIWDKLTL
jgi:hypothetical protein